MIRPLLFLLALGAMVPSAPCAAGDRGRAADRLRDGNGSCVARPSLALLPGFEDPRGRFRPGSRAFQTVEKRFAIAYRIACARSGQPPVLTGVMEPGRLFLRNAPDSNTVAIYRDGEGDGPVPMVMEYRFIGNDGRMSLPTALELGWAIACSGYTSVPPIDDPSECLVD